MTRAGRSAAFRSLAAALFCALAVLLGTAAEARRLAIVVGNDLYPALKADQQLQRAASDARAVSAKLKSMGFEVETVENANLRTLDRLLTQIVVRSGPGDTVLLFFAGHGLSIRGQNYLLPSDTDPPGMANELAAAETLRREAFLVDDVIERLRANGAANIVLMLDACRNNPFRTNEGRSIGASRGLARQETPQGVFLLFSAGFGEEALDRLPGGGDRDPNSVFTRTLVPLLDRPGLSLTDLAKEVQLGVRELAGRVGHPQTPAYYDQIVGRLSLVPGTAEPLAATPAVPSDPLAREAAAFGALPAGDAPALRNFLAAFPNGGFAELARLRLAALAPPPVTPVPEVRPEVRNEGAPGRLAALDSAPPPEVSPLDDRILVRRAQVALNRLGCEAGDADGTWGTGSQAALDRFARADGRPSGEGLSLGLVETLELRRGRVCAPACGTGEELQDGACVAKVCPPGQRLDDRGRCVRAAVAIRPAPVVRPPPSKAAPKVERARAPRAAPARRSGGGSCFTFNGRQVCE